MESEKSELPWPRKTDTDTNMTQVTNYTLNGSRITHMTRGTDWMHFYYGAGDRPVLVNFNGTIYTYVYSLQGDVVALLNAAGTTVVEYKYDAWGKVLGTTAATGCEALAEMNPFRYRGYVYDNESWMYYCRLRYFYPALRRWINLDEDLAGGHKLLGRNLLLYSANNPINCADTKGDKTYFINGISNDGTEEKEFLPNYAIEFENTYETLYDDDVICIPVFIGGDTWSGVSEVIQETLGNDVYTKEIVEMINNDLAQNPLRDGEKITLIGYSGGGIIAANVSMQLDHVDTIVFIGAPLFFPAVKANKILNVWAGLDPIASIGYGRVENYFSGFHGHKDYFKDTYQLNIIEFIRTYSN